MKEQYERTRSVISIKKGDGLAWEQDEITYWDRQIYIPNNRKIKE